MKKRRICFSLAFFLFLVMVALGCSFTKGGVPEWSGSGFVRKEFLEYKNIAVLPFNGDDSGEVSKAFSGSFHEKFPQISIVDQKRVLGVIRDKVLSPDRLDEDTRLEIGNTLDAQALIMGTIYYPSITRWFLQIVILDTKTGEVMGRSLVEIDFMGAMGKVEGARFAVEKLTPY